MKNITITMLVLISVLQACAQKSMDLSHLTFEEHANDYLKGFSNIAGSTMYNLNDMLSYGIDSTGCLVYDFYAPKHVEILAYQSRIAGFAFKISDFKSQEQLLAYLKTRYAKLSVADSSRWGKIYRYTDKVQSLELQTIAATEFQGQRTGYLSVKTIKLSQAIDEQEKKYQHKY